MTQVFHMDTVKKNNPAETSAPAIWCITPNGLTVAHKIIETWNNCILILSRRVSDLADAKQYPHKTTDKLSESIAFEFHNHPAHIFIFSTGIAVRLISKLLEHKTTDPAVVCMDDRGRFAISLVSGHLGGANQLARDVARLTGATPVITTATDANNLPAIDLIAQKTGCYIETPENIKNINMKILTGVEITVYDPAKKLIAHMTDITTKPVDASSANNCNLYCSFETTIVPRETLVLRPRVLAVGIGCNRGTSEKTILDFLKSVFKEEKLSINSIGLIGTSDVKTDEAGLIGVSKKLNVELCFFDQLQLNSIKNVPNPSKFAKKYLGVNSVCEAAALLSAGTDALLVTKRKNKDVTIAVAEIQ